MSNIQGKVVVVMGASSGIGEATTKKLAQEGAKLVIAARREDHLQGVVNHYHMVKLFMLGESNE